MKHHTTRKYPYPLSIAMVLLAMAYTGIAVAGAEDDQLLATARAFYQWALKHGKETVELEPRIKDVAGSTRFYLDTKSMEAFAAKFMSSKLFAPEFPSAISSYYNRYKAQIDSMSQKEFDETAKDGRGPILETEDMDIFFCAQEYEYKPNFIQGMKIKSSSINGDNATAVIESPYHWETEFKFHKLDGHWLIAGYCEYK